MFIFLFYMIISFIVEKPTRTHTRNATRNYTHPLEAVQENNRPKVLLKSVSSEGEHEREFSFGRVRLLRSKHQTVKEVRMCKVRSQFLCLQKPPEPPLTKSFFFFSKSLLPLFKMLVGFSS